MSTLDYPNPDHAPLEHNAPIVRLQDLNSDVRSDCEFPDGGMSAWRVVVGCCFSMMATFGVSGSMGIFQLHWSTHQLANYSTGSIAWILGTNTFLNLFLATCIGPLFDQYGSRIIMVGGSVAYITSLFLLGECQYYWHFFLNFGILAGFGGACISVVALTAPAQWFKKHRGLAMGLVSASTCIGGITVPFLLSHSLSRYSFKWTARILGFLVVGLLVPANTCVAERLRSKRPVVVGGLRWFRDRAFVWTTLGTSLFEFVLFNSLAFVPEYAVRQGFEPSQGSTALAVVNSGSAAGRFLSGWLSDRIGCMNVMLCTLAWSAAVSFGLWVIIYDYLVRLYVFALLFGFGTGSIIGLAGICYSQLCKADEFGGCWGSGYSIVSVVVLVSIPSGGEILSRLGGQSYALCMGSLLVLAFVCFCLARWSLLDGRWTTMIRI